MFGVRVPDNNWKIWFSVVHGVGGKLARLSYYSAIPDFDHRSWEAGSSAKTSRTNGWATSGLDDGFLRQKILDPSSPNPRWRRRLRQRFCLGFACFAAARTHHLKIFFVNTFKRLLLLPHDLLRAHHQLPVQRVPQVQDVRREFN